MLGVQVSQSERAARGRQGWRLKGLLVGWHSKSARTINKLAHFILWKFMTGHFGTKKANFNSKRANLIQNKAILVQKRLLGIKNANFDTKRTIWIKKLTF